MRRTFRQIAGQTTAILIGLLTAAGCTSHRTVIAAIESNGGHHGLAADSRWSAYADYLNGVEKRVVAKWYKLNDETRVAPPKGSHVTITFTLTSKGNTDIIKVEDVGCGKQGVWICESAIQDIQPFPKWTSEMVAALGEEQTVVFGFYYQ